MILTIVCFSLLAFAYLTRERPHRPMAEAVRLNPGLARKGW